MIVRLCGTLIDVFEDSVVIERDGLAREVLVPPFAIGELAACRGQSVSLNTMEFFEGNQCFYDVNIVFHHNRLSYFNRNIPWRHAPCS